MAYTLRNATTTNQVSHSARDNGDGTFTYSVQRYFVQFDLTGSGLNTQVVTAASLVLNITTVTNGSQQIHMYTGSDIDNWGPTLTGDRTDYISSRVNYHGLTTVSTTGAKAFTLNPKFLNYNGVTYIVLKHYNEINGAPSTNTSITFTSGNGTSNKPYLILYK